MGAQVSSFFALLSNMYCSSTIRALLHISAPVDENRLPVLSCPWRTPLWWVSCSHSYLITVGFSFLPLLLPMYCTSTAPDGCARSPVRVSNIGYTQSAARKSREGWRFAKQIHRPLTKSTDCQRDEKACKTRELTWTQVTAGCKCCRRWKQKLPLTFLLSGQFLRLRALSAL